MKPRLMKGWFGSWWCYTDEYFGDGHSPMAAYNNWYSKMLRGELKK